MSRRASPVARLRVVINNLKAESGYYNLGFGFVNSAVRLLEGSGLSKGESLDLLISHPPKELEEIVEASRYIGRITEEKES